MEQNVWDKFESAVIGNQGIINAKGETERELPKVKITDDWEKVLSGEADVAVITGDCLELMEHMPDECVDYIFTDPPYDASIQYGELSYLWNAWLKEDFHYTEKLVTHEIIRNEHQRKSFDLYNSLLSSSFRGFFKVLRKSRHLTLTFHNPTFKVRNATVRAGVFAGFDYQKIHHQPLGQVSAKAMLQPFGSAQGDFYLRFEKPASKLVRQMEEITEERFRRIVIETCKKVIAERAEPTPYTFLINHIDPILAKEGLFGTLQTGLNVKTVLEDAIGKDFKLVKARLGSAEGEMWWLSDPVFVARLQETPLSERVEETVYRCLNERGRVTFTQVWDAVSQQFPNSLTSDSTSIKEALEVYARHVGKGFWMLKEEIRLHVSGHGEIIALLALIGRKKGYDIRIAKNEQRSAGGVWAKNALLSSLVTVQPKKLNCVSNLKTVLDMDLLWLKGENVKSAFEVEATTTMTSALLRGSNIPKDVRKVMVIPEARESDFKRKMESPLFREHFDNESWNLAYFGALRQAFTKTKESTSIENLIGKKLPPSEERMVREDAQVYLDL